LEAIFSEAYREERFVHLLGSAGSPEVRHVRGTNLVHLAWRVLPEKSMAIVLTAIDNLGKGAAGQAVQNFNLMFGFQEDTAIDSLAAVP
jgi:N-acetyl-gamma-glutamyl-phosphate reductase